MRVFVEFDENQSAVFGLRLVVDQWYDGKTLLVDQQTKPGRIICHFDIPGNDEPGSAPGEFCRKTCEFLENLDLNPKFGPL